jgi:hypothetical protein
MAHEVAERLDFRPPTLRRGTEFAALQAPVLDVVFEGRDEIEGRRRPRWYLRQV